ncbi:MAG: hypothetical protein ACLGG0_15050 [Bacteriovoracia bacterium]
MKTLLASILFCFSALASTPDFELAQTSEQFASTLNQNSYSLALETVRVRTILEVGVEIPLISDFALAPEVELYFTSK